MHANGVELLFGPILIGVFLNCILYGTVVVQTFMYFQTYKRDRRWFKIFIFYLLICETLNTLCDIGMMYEPLVIRYGTTQAVTFAPIMLSADPALTVMVSLPVQLFIAWRVKIMSKSKIVPTIICFLAIAAFVGGVATAVSVAIINEYAHFRKFDAAALTWLASSTAADILITTSLVYNLSSKRTGFAATDDVINRIIRLTVHTGLITAVFASLDIALFLAFRGTTLNFIWDLSLSKLYSNSLLSTLNARGGWKATSSVRDNVLFGNGTDAETMARSRTTQVFFSEITPFCARRLLFNGNLAQIEIVSTRSQAVHHDSSSMVPMKVFDSGTGYYREGSTSATTVDQKFVDEV
ncbi:hypothetical protein OG21DRAFT_1482862 [Imleria badia]|nr:hypothetical protein OG21DRAFT_1482862 [Imleria badia]